MADLIHLLSDAVANQIAAGEVIQRPASVVKELVENSIDAGADKIQVQIKDAGRTLIQINDNGQGMSPTDARMAFERHATSKIREATDLFAIHTMGFRGEALASIASVAEVELRTCRSEDEIGTLIHISGSELLKQEAVSTSKGTNFMVKNLFFNVPARRKFLKSNTTEFKHIINEIQRVALANPGIAFSLYHNGTPVYDLPAANFRKRIVNIFGSGMNQSLVPIQNDTSIVKISGFIGQPKYARKTFGEQFFFVNGRFMKHPYFHRGVMQAYEKILPKDMVPAYFIAFDVDPSTIDINIHPTKTEIKFENETAMWQLLHAAVREGLGKFNVTPSIDFDQSGSIDIPVPPRSDAGLTQPEIRINPNFNPFEENSISIPSRGFSSSGRNDENTAHWEQLYQTPDQEIKLENHEQHHQTSFIDQGFHQPAEQGKNFLIMKNRYILTPVKSGLMVIDQRRAHQRILYEQYMVILTNEEGISQQLLFPQTLEMNSSDATLLVSMLPDLNAIGFDIREFGPETFIINGIPGFLHDTNAKGIIEKMLEDYKSTAGNLKEQAREHLAMSLAIASAVDYDYPMSKEEAGALIDSLFACQTPNYSPAGKPVLEIIPLEEIEKKLR
ncbi:DNA mismatch repair endonuclease MutL [Roseimarinus sediminis]|uniref:DNA mismatch repair endonuclease MutL n=1 Tax=Roseimarinus sediminis TaxID=1610899 RepID=UPI003D26379B